MGTVMILQKEHLIDLYIVSPPVIVLEIYFQVSSIRIFTFTLDSFIISSSQKK